jgi:ornithine carbamoyltransferase
MQHFLSIEQLSRGEIFSLLHSTAELKASRGSNRRQSLAGQTWALLFSKPSTRTRVSFEVGLRELGAGVMFLAQTDIQLGRGEPIVDTARVLGRMIQGAIIRTFDQREVELFAQYSRIPTINALTDQEHPCQIIADLFTILERRKSLDGLKVCFVGDGDCNVARSWLWAAEHLGFELRVAAPSDYQPPPTLKERLTNRKISYVTDAAEGAAGASVLYTDVWVSMGKEVEGAKRLADLAAFQINQALLDQAERDALVLHCLPAYRGKEIAEDVLEAHAETIFDQAENRLHAQKAIVLTVEQATRAS